MLLHITSCIENTIFSVAVLRTCVSKQKSSDNFSLFDLFSVEFSLRISIIDAIDERLWLITIIILVNTLENWRLCLSQRYIYGNIQPSELPKQMSRQTEKKCYRKKIAEAIYVQWKIFFNNFER